MKKFLIFIFLINPLFVIAQLTGYWNTDTGGCYQIRQNDNKVWWTYEENSNTQAKNVFYGEIFNNQVIGHWCDLPSHSRSNCNEQLILRIEGNNRLVKIYESRSYTGNTWTRLSGTCGSNPGTREEPDGIATTDPCFRAFPDQKLSGNNKNSPKTLSIKEAMEYCKNNSWCKSFGYDPKTNKAYFKTKNRFEKKLSSSSHTHYHNVCRE